MCCSLAQTVLEPKWIGISSCIAGGTREDNTPRCSGGTCPAICHAGGSHQPATSPCLGLALQEASVSPARLGYMQQCVPRLPRMLVRRLGSAHFGKSSRETGAAPRIATRLPSVLAPLILYAWWQSCTRATLCSSMFEPFWLGGQAYMYSGVLAKDTTFCVHAPLRRELPSPE